MIHGSWQDSWNIHNQVNEESRQDTSSMIVIGVKCLLFLLSLQLIERIPVRRSVTVLVINLGPSDSGLGSEDLQYKNDNVL